MAESKLRQLGLGRRQWDDPLFTEGNRVCRLFLREGICDIDDDQLSHKVVPVFPCEVPGCKETFDSLENYQSHFNSRHHYVCKECRKPFPSAHLLDLHISETHDSFFAVLAERKPMFQCFVEQCDVKSKDASERRKHCIEDHNFPHDFRFDQSLKKNKNQNPNEQKTGESPEAMMVDESQDKKPPRAKPITFGRGKRGKAFSNTRPWHTVGKEEANKDSNREISTAELMEVLPS